MPFSRSISPQSTRRSERLFKIFFLGVLGELCGDLSGFLFDLTGRFLAGGGAEPGSLLCEFRLNFAVRADYYGALPQLRGLLGCLLGFVNRCYMPV